MEINIIKPQKGLYIRNNRVIPLLFRTIIFGDIKIEVEAAENIGFGILLPVEKVQFYIDGVLKHEDFEEPYNWTWTKEKFINLKHRHKIKVVAVAYSGFFGDTATISEEITVKKFL